MTAAESAEVAPAAALSRFDRRAMAALDTDDMGALLGAWLDLERARELAAEYGPVQLDLFGGAAEDATADRRARDPLDRAAQDEKRGAK